MAGTSKKLTNSPLHAVEEALSGLVSANSGLQLLEGGHHVVVRADIEQVISKGRVTLLSGGGSGHEPAQAGYVGHGMLSAAVSGAVFASPPPASILAALRAIKSPGGTLMIVTNYTGDRLTFGIALERARAEGIEVAMVIVGDDCALADAGNSVGRRGLCGTILVHKVAGALAEQGSSLEEVVAVAQQVADNLATMSVSLSPCSVPGHKPSFTLKDDEMELGLGVHGEAGTERTKSTSIQYSYYTMKALEELQPADVVVERMLKQITLQDPGYQYFKPELGMKVALVVNNLGGSSNLELSVVANSAIKYLVDKMQVKVARAYMGRFMTSLEMAGVSLTLLKLLPNWEQCLDFPTTAPGWPSASAGIHDNKTRTDSSPLI